MSQTLDREMIRDLIEEILKAKEDAEVQEAVESLLEKAKATIQELSESLEAKDTEIAEMEAKLTESAELYETAKTELETKMTEIEELQKNLEEAQTTLAEIEKDRVANERMEKLEEAKVARTGEARDVQFTKVREMTEESFEEYAAELVSLRESLLEELKAAQAEVVEEETPSEEEVAEEEVEEEAASEEEVETPPAEINEKEAVAAALNMEVALDEDAKKKWASFAKAFASKLTGETDEVEG